MPRPRLLRVLGVAVVVGAASGLASGLFLEALRLATGVRGDHPWLLFLLPVAGGVIAWVYAGVGRSAGGGTDLILDQIHGRPEAEAPFRIVPLILASTVATHLFGGSAGREGTAVQMGGGIAADLARRLRLDRTETRLALMCGISGGFGSVFGTPLAGAVFGMEVLALGAIRYDALVPCLVAALAGDETVRLLGVAHARYAVTSIIPDLSPGTIAKVALLGLGCGIVSAAFSELTVLVEHGSRRLAANPIVRTSAGGVAVVGITLLLGTRAYSGLSLPLIAEAFRGDAPTFAFLIKLGLTALTLGVGFKGGEVTPLFVIGATFGAALSAPLGLPVDLAAALGFVAVFGAAANAPIACVVLGVELFGGDGVVYIGIATFVAYAVSGHRGIYAAQRVAVPKHRRGGVAVTPEITLREIREARRPLPETMTRWRGAGRGRGRSVRPR